MRKGRWLAILTMAFLVFSNDLSVADDAKSGWDNRPREVQRAQEVIEGTIRNTLPTLNMFYNEFFAKVEAHKPSGIAITSERDMISFIRLKSRIQAFRQSTFDLSAQLDQLTPRSANAITLEERVLLAKPTDYKKPISNSQIKELERLRLEASKKLFCVINTLEKMINTPESPDYDCSQL